jgi:hypothetical protein
MMFAKHEELSEQLTSWWQTQTDFKTKKDLAGFLGVHPDTLGDYFSGRKFPRSDIADRLSRLTYIGCLRPEPDNFSLLEVATEQPEMGLPPEGGRHGERSVVISLERTTCPFCVHDIVRFRSCAHCGQHFVWANIPLENDGPM